IRTLQALHEINPQVTCCFMTGQPAPYGDAQLLELGAAGVLRKPFSLADVAEILHRLAGDAVQPESAGQLTDRPVWPRRCREVQVLLADLEGKETPFPAVVVNYSMGGLCLTTSREVEEGTVLRARTPAAMSSIPWVQIKVRNRRRTEDAWELGCEFV